MERGGAAAAADGVRRFSRKIYTQMSDRYVSSRVYSGIGNIPARGGAGGSG